jgi:hypothetical protein
MSKLSEPGFTGERILLLPAWGIGPAYRQAGFPKSGKVNLKKRCKYRRKDSPAPVLSNSFFSFQI